MLIKIGLINIINFIIYIILGLLVFYFNGIIGVLENILSIIILIIIFYGIYFLIKKIFRSKDFISLYTFMSRFLLIFGIFIITFIGIIGGTTYYFNEKSPAYMPEYTLTNGDKTVVFQGMIHIGGEKFYNEVAKNLKNYKNNGFIHFFEGVRHGTPENQEFFNKTLGVEFGGELYENISKLFGLVSQDYRKIIGEISEKDMNIDLSLDDIVEEYKKIEIKNIDNKKDVINPKQIKESIDSLNSRQLKLFGYIGRGLLNAMIQNKDSLRNFSTIGNEELTKIIIGKRDKNLSDEIINSENKKIYITYGLLHFEGVLENLKKDDPNWKVINVKNLRPFE